jgi:hypothetical protein
MVVEMTCVFSDSGTVMSGTNRSASRDVPQLL